MKNPGRFSAQSIYAILLAAIPGTTGQAIVGGHSIPITQAPWQCHLSVDLGGGTSSGCGASWIGGRWVVCAAHCVDEATNSNATIVAGITKMSEDKASLRVKVDQIYRVATNWENPWRDISVLHLASDITATLARPIRYATPADETAGYDKVGSTCVATGWGFVTGAPTYNSKDSLQSVTSKIHSLETYVINWAGQGGSTWIGSCQGDSGGPLVVQDGTGAWILVGASSYISSTCGDPNSASSYARVAAFASWIQQTTGVVSVSPAPHSMDVAPLSFLGSDRFRLTRDQNLELTLVDLSGGKVWGHRRFFAAGEHSLAYGTLAKGQYVLQVKTAETNFRQNIRLSR